MSVLVRRIRNSLAVLAILVALYALIGFVVVPAIARSKIESIGTAELGRTVTLGKVELNPFTLKARLSDFALADRGKPSAAARFASLDLDLSLASLWNFAPVLDGARLVQPHVELVLNQDGTHSFEDLVQRLTAPREGPRTEFSINNIEVEDGSLSFDDRPHNRKVGLSAVRIGIPFLSSFAYDAKIHVAPRLDGAVDGVRFALNADSTSPFEDAQQATLELNVNALPLAPYTEYLTLPSGMKVAEGRLTTRLKLSFLTERGAARDVSISGTTRIDNLALQRKDGSSLLAVRSADAVLAKANLLDRSIALERLAVDAAQVDLQRDPGGDLEMERLFAGDATTSAAAAKSKAKVADKSGGVEPSRPWRYSLAGLEIANSTLRFTDKSVSPVIAVPLTGVTLKGERLSSTGGPGHIELSFEADESTRVNANADIDLADKSAHGHFDIKGLRSGRLQPYYAGAVHSDVRRGTLDFSGDFDVAAGGDSFSIKDGTARIADFEAAIPSERDPSLRIARLDIAGIDLDSAKRTLAIASADVHQSQVRIVRQRDGEISLVRIARPAKALERVEQRVGAPSGEGKPWRVALRKMSLERMAADFEDDAVTPPVKLRVADARITVENLSSNLGDRMPVDVAAKVLPAGQLSLKGTIVPEPFAFECVVKAAGFDVMPLRPYFDSLSNVVVTKAAISADGKLRLAQSGKDALQTTWAGDIVVNDFASLDRPTSQELMSWKTLTLGKVELASSPFKLALGGLAMDRFYARVILNADGTLNLQQLLATPASSPEAKPAEPAVTTGRVTTKELPETTRGDLPVSIGRIELTNGEVRYSDLFVKPNYTAHLTQFSGNVSKLSATEAGTVDVQAKVEGTAPVDIHGTINPFARQITLDLTGKASDVDLPPLTPYSVKYAGYDIQKGKLSLEVHYQIADQKLSATNKLKLDQLTFGNHVDSPTATKLPVLLAVALLKDRNGVINLDLPIQGTLDDPQFSVWGIVVQIVVNLITKAVTAPFALLGALAGGHSEQLAYVEFAPGRAELNEEAQGKLRSLAKALNDRPGLKIDARGRAIPDADVEGLKRAMLDRAIRTQQRKASAEDASSASSDDVKTIEPAEYEKLLSAVYKNADLPDKPRNALGIAKAVPASEMEAMLMKSYVVSDDMLVALANDRAQAIKQWFAGDGGISTERVYVLAARLGSDGITDKGAPTRVDFAIR